MNRRLLTVASLVAVFAACSLLPVLAGCKKQESLDGEVQQGAKTRDEALRIQKESNQRSAEGANVLDGK